MNSPNVLWIFIEDMNDWLGCYGHQVVPTPNIDQLAESGVRLTERICRLGFVHPPGRPLLLVCIRRQLVRTTIGVQDRTLGE